MNRLLCLLNRHKPLRDTARWDGLTYAGSCRWCGKEIVRQRKGVWTAASDSAAQDPS